MEIDGIEVLWDGHASLRFVDRGFTVAVDPFSGVSPDFRADLVLITHDDEGHFDPVFLEKVCKEGTCVVVPESMREEDLPCQDVEYIGEGEIIDVFGVEIEAVPMYNEHHERGEGVGYRFVMGSTRFYVAGDTGLIEEAHEMEKRADVAFLPVEGVFTMDIEEAVKMAARIKPGVVVPYHYGGPFFEDMNLKPLKTALADRSIECKILD